MKRISTQTRCKPRTGKFILVKENEKDVGIIWTEERAEKASMAEVGKGYRK